MKGRHLHTQLIYFSIKLIVAQTQWALERWNLHLIPSGQMNFTTSQAFLSKPRCSEKERPAQNRRPCYITQRPPDSHASVQMALRFWGHCATYHRPESGEGEGWDAKLRLLTSVKQRAHYVTSGLRNGVRGKTKRNTIACSCRNLFI